MLEWLEQTLYGTVTWFNLLTALLIFLAALLVSKLISVQLRRSLKDKLAKERLEILIKFATYGVIVIAALWIMPTIGIEPSGLLVAGGIVGLAVGFASQSIIGNLISGLFGLFIRIPNETVFTSSITNYSCNPVRRFELAIGISYADDANQAIKIIKEIAAEHPLILINPPPQVFVDALGDSSVDLIARFWSPTSEWYSVKMELLWQIKVAIEAEEIEIPFPQRVIWSGAGEKADLPDSIG